MTPDDFRRLALELPEAVEQAHRNHPDFRVGGKIFATLSPEGEGWAMVKLPPAEQATFVRRWKKAFEPFPGAWGKRGCTRIWLENADEGTVRQALELAWRGIAPKRLLR